MEPTREELIEQGRRSQLRNKIYNAFVATGEKSNLNTFLHEELHACGWINMVRRKCEKLLMQDNVESLSIEDIVETLLPDIRAAIPETLKKELLKRVQKFICAQKLDISK